MAAPNAQRILDLLDGMRSKGLTAAKELFWSELNYDHANNPLALRSWPQRTQDMLVGPPLLMARHGSPDNAFDVVYAKLSPAQRGRVFPLSITAERMVINQLLGDHPTALFVFSDEQ